MFPGIDGFRWTLGHVLFLSLFFAVVLTILTTVASAACRTARDFRTHQATDLCWKSDFAELPVSDRRCRHELAGRVISRTCDNAFDCRHCGKYSQFAVLPATGNVRSLGLEYSDDRYYHRGHTWVMPAEDGTVTIGLDELAGHLVGNPDSICMPEIGAEIEVNQSAWRMRKNGKEIDVRAPIEGTIVGIGGPEQGWYLKIRTRFDLQDPSDVATSAARTRSARLVVSRTRTAAISARSTQYSCCPGGRWSSAAEFDRCHPRCGLGFRTR